ncbi:hypothetical protein HYPSUDRAFT_41852 [Hypholoma sublateritium FD-334 SS-4]|uniref:MHC class I region proline-rich protein CAT53 n=1 Tax=Hypholoma sublateritium (strain FD-334 SS-4) TaxID=945553 RepID=A0A0D2PPB6_HYPSF|nr:hypothetical protein HYPSUDRAFT_41852 [Hypholoma sublateritium FD-334 SS-4]
MDYSQWEQQRTGPDPSTAAPASDLNDFADLPGEHAGPAAARHHSPRPGPSSSAMAATFFSPYVIPNANFHYQAAPYPTIAYGQPWSTAVPLSSYSSLVGATTNASPQPQAPPLPQHSPPQQHQQPHPSSSGHMVIESAFSSLSSPVLHSPPSSPLLSLNGVATSSIQSAFPAPTSYSDQQQQQQQQSHQQQQQHQQLQQLQQQQQQQSQSQSQMQARGQYYNPPIVYPYYRHQQAASAPQGTLSPIALHSPTGSLMNIQPTSFYPQPQQMAPNSPVASTSQQPIQQYNTPATSPPAPAPAGPTPEEREERKRVFQASIRPLLQPAAFTGAQAVRELTDRIAEYGLSEVDAATRLDIVGAIRDGAGNHYFRAWSENATAIDITREWIKAAARGNNALLVETTMPLLHLIDRLPLDVLGLMESKLGKIIKKLVKDEPSPAIKDLAANLERKWRNMLSNADGGARAPENNGAEDSKTKKRKPESAPGPKGSGAQPLKKAAVGTAGSVRPLAVKREPVAGKIPPAASGAAAAAAKDAAKADSSFFSAPKPKPKKLPSFNKKPPAPASGAGVAQASPLNAFEEALKSMKSRNSPAAPTPPPTGGAGSAAGAGGASGSGRGLRRKKSVTWAPDDRLESVRFIEKAVYDDDPVDGTHVAHSLRDLDRGEGAALHAHLFEETIDWAEPLLVDLPPEPEGHTRFVRGSASQEKSTQEEREQSALSAVYMSPNQIPDSPAEPAVVLTDDEVDREAKTMSVGAALDALFQWGAEPALPPPGAAASVAELVGQLAMGSLMDVGGGAPGAPAQMDMQGAASATLAAVQGLLPQDQLQQLLAQLSSSASAAAGPPYGLQNPPQQPQPPTQQQLAAYAAEGWGQSLYDYGHHQYAEDGAGAGGAADQQQQRGWADSGRGRGRGGGGRGRGRGAESKPYQYNAFNNARKKPCSFFAAGRCKYGDLCDFMHEMEP